MPAHSETFPWPSYYGHFDFFEKRMAAHSRVDHLQSLGNGLYDLTRSNGKTLKVFVCECYSFGVAEHLEATSKLGHLDAIIIASNWCGYSRPLSQRPAAVQRLRRNWPPEPGWNGDRYGAGQCQLLCQQWPHRRDA